MRRDVVPQNPGFRGLGVFAQLFCVSPIPQISHLRIQRPSCKNLRMFRGMGHLINRLGGSGTRKPDRTTYIQPAQSFAFGVISVGPNEFSAEDIQHIEPYHVVVRSEVEGYRQPAFITKLPNFEADIAGYRAAQGDAPVTTGGATW